MLTTHCDHIGICCKSLLLTGNICICFGQVGSWKYSLQASSQTLTLTVTSRAASVTLPPITVTPIVNKNTGKFPNPVRVYATIRQGASPILRASVTALIESVNGKTETLELLDNGAGNHRRNWKLVLLLRHHYEIANGHGLVRTVGSREPGAGGWLKSSQHPHTCLKTLGNMRRGPVLASTKPKYGDGLNSIGLKIAQNCLPSKLRKGNNSHFLSSPLPPQYVCTHKHIYLHFYVHHTLFRCYYPSITGEEILSHFNN